MSKAIDITGQRFGRLTVIRRDGTYHGATMWECRCDCGNMTRSTSNNLRRGLSKSCGCARIERVKEALTTHGHSQEKLYRVWAAMIQRTESKSFRQYCDYGGRGIKVCDAWHDYEVFRAWAISHGYCEGLSIERENVDGDYCPENCSWIPRSDQANNRRNTVYVTYQGETVKLKTLAERTGVDRHILYNRIVRGWRVEDAVSCPEKRKGRRPVCKTETAAKKTYAKRIIPQKGKEVNEKERNLPQGGDCRDEMRRYGL